MQPDEYRAFTDELTERLRADERAIGLVAVGSMADRDYAPDEWSDHDFFVITPPGGQEELRNDLRGSRATIGSHSRCGRPTTG